MSPVRGVATAGGAVSLVVAAVWVLTDRFAKRRVGATTAPPAAPSLSHAPPDIRLCRRCDASTPHNNDRQCHTCTGDTP